MPALAPAQDPVSHEEYLAAELLADTRHEFLGGYVAAMAGGTMAHAKVKTNLTV